MDEIMAKKNKQESKDSVIIEEANDRFRRCDDWESTFRSRYKEDIKFYNGDPDNGYQWPIDVRKNRDVEKRPILTINKTRQYCLNITNDAKQNKASIKVRPVGDTATYEGSEIMEGIIRHIEYISNAEIAYDKANETQVQGGIGYWRVVTDYVDDKSFDQEIFIRRIKDPLTVYLDPDINEVDGSDARFAFVYDDVPRDKFDKEYPSLKDKVGKLDGIDSNDWISKDHVRVAEYYRRVEKYSEILAVTDPDTGEVNVFNSDDLPPEIYKGLAQAENVKKRPVTQYSVEWFKLAADQIIERAVWPGSTIPIVRVIGEESVIEGKLDRKGHVRALKDPQRIYNYWSSSGVEFVALQSKSPFMAPAAAIEGYTDYWGSANTENHSVLPWNHVDDSGNPIPAPIRAQPPVMAAAYIQGMNVAKEEMMMASGQYQADLGEPGNEKSGVAINARQRQGDNATYHFIENMAIAIRYTGKILIELIPKIYDTRRVLKIMGEDGIESQVIIDPNARAEFMAEQESENGKIKIIFNPTFAKYSVVSDVGPAYATRRQEAFNAFTQIMAQQPDLMKVAGDLMFRAADFPMADELAERLKRMVPPAVLGKGLSPEVQQLMQENQQLHTTIQTLMQQYAGERGSQQAAQHKSETDAFNAATRRVTEEQQKEIDVYKAETERLKALMAGFDPNQIASLTAQLVLQSMQTSLPIQQNS
jgi:hypothetical protein